MAGLRAYRQEQNRLYAPAAPSLISPLKEHGAEAGRHQAEGSECAAHTGAELAAPGAAAARPPHVAAAAEAHTDDFCVLAPNGSDIVKSCTGSYYRVPGRCENVQPVWRKLDSGGERYVYSNRSGVWVICTSEIEMKRNNGHVKSQTPHNGRRPGAMMMETWQRHNGASWVSDGSISVISLQKSPLEVLSAIASKEEVVRSRKRERDGASKEPKHEEASAAKQVAQKKASPRKKPKKEEAKELPPKSDSVGVPDRLRKDAQPPPPLADVQPPPVAVTKDAGATDKPAVSPLLERSLRLCVSDSLHNIKPGLRISKSAMESIIRSVHHMVKHLTTEALEQSEAVGRTSVSSKETLKAVYALLPPALADKVSEKADEEFRRRNL